ncbi:hypothetical protein HMI56_005301, partial [Coelomomyces lativittatus]
MSHNNQQYTHSMTRELENRLGKVTPTIEGKEIYNDSEEIFYEERRRVPQELYPLELPKGSHIAPKVK